MSPQRIQRKRTAGWRMPEGAVYVGRPGKWGNPYRLGSCKEWQAAGVGDWSVVPTHWWDGRVHVGAAAAVVERYRRWVVGPFNPHHYTGCVPKGPIKPTREWHVGWGMGGTAGTYAVFQAPFTPAEIRDALGGHDLACWCALDAPCHADVLLQIANDLPLGNPRSQP